VTETAELTRGERLEAGYGLAPADRAALTRCETIIRGGLETWYQVGTALMEIRDSRLYAGAYKTFEAYCRDRWGITHRHANRQIAAAEVAGIITAKDQAAASLGPDGPAPSSEAQARELTPLRGNPAAVRKAWTRAWEAAGDKPPPARIVRQAVREYQQEQAQRRQAREQRAAERKQQEPDTPAAGPDPDPLRLHDRTARLGQAARALLLQVTFPGLDSHYPASERAALADAISGVLDLLTEARETLTRE
jgi:hypothetical protein